jgi:hypothetical protein
MVLHNGKRGRLPDRGPRRRSADALALSRRPTELLPCLARRGARKTSCTRTRKSGRTATRGEGKCARETAHAHWRESITLFSRGCATDVDRLCEAGELAWVGLELTADAGRQRDAVATPAILSVAPPLSDAPSPCGQQCFHSPPLPIATGWGKLVPWVGVVHFERLSTAFTGAIFSENRRTRHTLVLKQ